MPTYDYLCRGCGHEFELFQRMTADPEKKCPNCKKLKLTRLIGSGSGVVFKGSGFYQTDYRSESYKQKAAEETKSASSEKSDTKSESKSSEAKPAKADKPKKPKSE
ncbi:FmdB family zinc ribbon protein [Lignipirellula cremea]|uniref:Zinc ribbon domain protein n=1 Tax=Lignipirellula cremea TaxID=2528010 RepID=A0A518DXW3_9BACT|nr:zinc ribbon domain-containing protein [Lignipirellula cremea]QDU96674.1 Zinc ribbon domain protein [Lignipirellula cremea]